LSPAIHEAALGALDVPGIYLPFDCDAESLDSLLEAAERDHVRGFNVTIPHKEAIVEKLDELDGDAERLGAVNTVVIGEGWTKGHNTDVFGFRLSLRSLGLRVGDRRVLVVGAGGAAKAVVDVLVREGAKVQVTNRTMRRADVLADSFDESVEAIPLDALTRDGPWDLRSSRGGEPPRRRSGEGPGTLFRHSRSHVPRGILVSDAEIARLREEIADVDREIVAHVAKRLHLAEQLGVEKKLEGRPVVAEDTEDRVFTRLLTEGATRGISLSFAEGLARLLIDESVHVQDLVRLPKSAKQKILVVGGAGQMGRWLCRYFRSRGYDVVVNDIAGPLEDFPFEPDLAKGVLAANVVAVAVPMSVCADILNRIAAIKPRALIFDVASLKAPIERELRAMGHAGLRVASVHPVFGPRLWPLSSGNITFS